MDTELAEYIVCYYGDLMSEQEKLAYRHLQNVMKVTHGRSDSAAQQEVKRAPHPLREMLSEDAEVLRLAAGGMDKFAEQTAKHSAATRRQHRSKSVSSVWRFSENA